MPKLSVEKSIPWCESQLATYHLRNIWILLEPRAMQRSILAMLVVFVASTALGLASADVWNPSINTTWQWQLKYDIDTSFGVEMYDIDLFGTSGVSAKRWREFASLRPARPLDRI